MEAGMAEGIESAGAPIGDGAGNGDCRAMPNPAALLQALAELEAEFAHLFAEWQARTGAPAGQSAIR
jgi:hypothetical protein